VYIVCGKVVQCGNVAASTGHTIARARVEKGPAARHRGNTEDTLSPSGDVGSIGKILPRSTRDFIQAAAAAGAGSKRICDAALRFTGSLRVAGAKVGAILG
jgi:hypothetical protein